MRRAVRLARDVGTARGRAAVRAGGHHRLPRRLPRAALGLDVELRRVPRSRRRQADRVDGARAARAGRSADHAGARRGGDHRPRDHRLGAARMDGQIGARAHVAVSIFGKWKTTLQIIGISFMLYREPLLTLARLSDRRVAAVRRGRADVVVDDRLPARRLAGNAGARLGAARRGRCRLASARPVEWRPQRGNSSVGRARPCQGRGREFESRFPLHLPSDGLKVGKRNA